MFDWVLNTPLLSIGDYDKNGINYDENTAFPISFEHLITCWNS